MTSLTELTERHPVLAGVLGCSIFFLLGSLNPATCRLFGFGLFYTLGVLWLVGLIIFSLKWEWVCSSCGKQEYGKREKYCRVCGGEMVLKREEIPVKYCANGHRIKDRYNSAKFCPKCGVPLGEKENR